MLKPEFDDSIFEESQNGSVDGEELTEDKIVSHVDELNKKKTQSQSICLDEIEEKTLEWVWPGRIPLNKPTLMGGDPGKGKTMLALDIAARVSSGEHWPDGAKNQPGDVLILTAEDDLGDTIKPRLRAAGANLSRIFALETIEKYDQNDEITREALPNLVDDFIDIEREIKARNPRLIIIDPLNGFLPGVDTHRDSEMRSRVFAPMKKMLDDSGAALIYIVHLNKSSGRSATHRIMGSMANIAAARSSWIVADNKDSDDKLFVPDKFNIAEKPDGLSFKIIGNQEDLPVVAWNRDPVDVNADDVLRPDGSTAPERDTAKEFLIEILKSGPVLAKDIFEEAKAFDIKPRTLKRAKKELDIQSEGVYEKGKKGVQGWKWKLSEGI